MHDLLIAAAFLTVVVAPSLMATRATAFGKDTVKP